MLFSRDARFLRRPSHRRVWNAPLRLHSGDIFDAGLFRIWAYYCLASLLGIIVSLIFLGYAYHTAPRQESIVLWLDPECTSPSQCPVVANSSVRASGEIRPGFSSFVAPCDRGWTLERVKNMVSRTKGYYARDYSAFLGWNNMRYIIEAAALHAKLLNRTLVIPSYVYARACEWDVEVCAGFAAMMDREDVSWSLKLREKESNGWKIPIEIMLDLNTLRQYVPTVTVAEYLALNSLDPAIERKDGKWDTTKYHITSSSPRPSIVIISNEKFDSGGIVRVDRLPANHTTTPPNPTSKEGEILIGLSETLDRWRTVPLKDAYNWIWFHAKEYSWRNEEETVRILRKYGLGVLTTFKGRSFNPEKTVTEPIRVVAPRHEMRGLIDDFGHYREDVLLIRGELHDFRVPGSLFFTSNSSRDDFTNLVLRGIVHLPPIELLADAVALQMRKFNDGRMWMAAHWRRGDYVDLKIALAPTVESSISRILGRLRQGADRLRQYAGDASMRVAEVPGVFPDTSFQNANAPLSDDKWFLATDERDPEALAYARAHNATLLSDLLTNIPHLRRLVGWPLLYTDVLALVEQCVMARAAFFWGHYRSSVVGGVVNMRAVRGMDPRTTILDDND